MLIARYVRELNSSTMVYDQKVFLTHAVQPEYPQIFQNTPSGWPAGGRVKAAAMLRASSDLHDRRQVACPSRRCLWSMGH